MTVTKKKKTLTVTIKNYFRLECPLCATRNYSHSPHTLNALLKFSFTI